MKRQSRNTGQHSHNTGKPAAAISDTRRELTAIILIALLAGIPFAFGRYFELNYPDPFDSASNVYSAQHILNGARIGIEEQPSAALGTLLVNILGVRLFGFSEFGPKLIQSIMQAAALILMFIAMKKVFGKLPAAVGVIVASVYLSSPLIAKFGNVKEQYMIACMVTAVSLFVLRQSGGGWWYALLTGAIAAWAPLFKETGFSAIGAIGLFVLMQPIFKHRTWKQTGTDIVLLLAGAIISMAPVYIWIIGWDVQTSLPYSFVWKTISGVLIPSKETAEAVSYVSGSRKVLPFSEQWPRVLRHYWMLILPIALATGSILLRIYRFIAGIIKKPSTGEKCDYERFVLLFAVWWVLDMAFVWVSPRSYEQYYLPLNASAAMTGGYLVAVYRDKLYMAVFKNKWILVGLAGLVLMTAMSWDVFFGISKSPYSGAKYPDRRRGYVQKYREITQRRTQHLRGPWEVAGEYIRHNTQPTDKIYVWGWVPGIYLSAQRFSSTPKAFESEMHTRPPEEFDKRIQNMLADFEKEMPKYIVDSRKNHVPLERPPHELWPIVPKGFMGAQKAGFLPNAPRAIADFENQWGQMLRERFDDDEARRFEAVGRFRKFIREHYEIVQMFGDHVVFKLKTTPANTNSQ